VHSRAFEIGVLEWFARLWEAPSEEEGASFFKKKTFLPSSFSSFSFFVFSALHLTVFSHSC